ncbi:MAG: cell division protein FtsW [Clostridiales bacterium GWD2_32_19]|nr:MAG: cell division protein FtsW [Clostridiales bacterium GWD2_32_19]
MLMLMVLSLVLFGLVMIFSASYYQAIDRYSDMFYFLKKQGMWVFIGIFTMIVVMNINYKLWGKLAMIAYASCIGLLGTVLVMGVVAKGAARWFKVIGGASIQPSEFTKIAVILFLANLLSKKNGEKMTGKDIGKYFFFLMLPVILVMIENISTALVILVIGTTMLFIKIMDVKVLYIVSAICVVGYMTLYYAVPIMNLTAYVPEKYKSRIHRIEVWLDPWADPQGAGFQTIQSLYAVGSGGVWGLGLGESRQKLGYIPEAHNDIIFSILCEELGLVGATVLIFVFLMLIWKGIKISTRAPDMFSSLVAMGITTMVAIQVIINIAVITNTIPVTGMPLPFISYGGSSLLTLLISMGILLNISKHAKE